MRIVVSSLALRDQIREAHFWKKQDTPLAQEFFDEFDVSIKAIQNAPETHGYINREWNIRRFLELRFHTWIVYRYVKERDEIQILRVYNARMNPSDFLNSLDQFT